MGHSTPETALVRVGKRPLRIEEVTRLAEGRSRVELDPDPEVRERIHRSRRALEERLREGTPIYGVRNFQTALPTSSVPSIICTRTSMWVVPAGVSSKCARQ